MSSSFGGALATPQIVARRAFALTDCLFSALSGALRSGSCVAPTSSVVATATAVRARHGTLPNPSHWRRRRAAGDSTRPQLRAPRLAALVQRSQCGLPHTPQGPLPVRSGSRRRCRCCRRRRHPCPLPARRCGRHPRRQRPRCRPSWPLQREVSDACEKARVHPSAPRVHPSAHGPRMPPLLRAAAQRSQRASRVTHGSCRVVCRLAQASASSQVAAPLRLDAQLPPQPPGLREHHRWRVRRLPATAAPLAAAWAAFHLCCCPRCRRPRRRRFCLRPRRRGAAAFAITVYVVAFVHA